MRFLFVPLLALSSCIVVTDQSGTLALTWELRGSDGSAVACLPGEEVHVVALGHRFAYPCTNGGAVTGLVPTGSYTATVELYTQDGLAPIVVSLGVNVYSESTTDLGHVIFTVYSSPANGSATFVWGLHQYTLDAPAEACVPGETLYFEIDGIAPFEIDCSAYDSQPVDDLAPGRYNAYVALSFDGVLEDDPRPGYGATEIDVSFDVFPGSDTEVPLDFVVQAGPARLPKATIVGSDAHSEGQTDNSGRPAPRKNARRSEK